MCEAHGPATQHACVHTMFVEHMQHVRVYARRACRRSIKLSYRRRRAFGLSSEARIEVSADDVCVSRRATESEWVSTRCGMPITTVRRPLRLVVPVVRVQTQVAVVSLGILVRPEGEEGGAKQLRPAFYLPSIPFDDNVDNSIPTPCAIRAFPLQRLHLHHKSSPPPQSSLLSAWLNAMPAPMPTPMAQMTTSVPIPMMIQNIRRWMPHIVGDRSLHRGVVVPEGVSQSPVLRCEGGGDGDGCVACCWWARPISNCFGVVIAESVRVRVRVLFVCVCSVVCPLALPLSPSRI
jgi:hypothetical protein